MKTNKRMMTLAMAITALLGAGVLMAAGPMAPPGPIPFSNYDSNGDGRISVDEFYAARNARIAEQARKGGMMRNAGNAPAFEQFDIDGDGYLSENELLKGQLSQLQENRMNRPMGGPGGPGGPGARPMASFSDFDSNSDGVVTPEEFDQTRAARQAEKATQGYPMRNAASSPSFATFDSNGDGVLTPDEFVPRSRNRLQQ